MTRQCCPACAQMAGAHRYDVNGYGIGRCVACGSLFVEDMPPPQELAALYAAEAYYDLPHDALLRIDQENRRRMRAIHQLKPGGSLLDIGCAQGMLLAAAAQMGYRVCGVEPGLRNARMAAQGGIEVLNGTLEEFAAAHPGRRFDIITCLDVIEHVAEPRAFLAMALTLLAKDGVMLVSTPNYSGLVARVLGARDPYMTPPEHVVFLTGTGMRRLAEVAGLKVLRRRTFGRLIEAEIERVVQRYLPRPLYLLEPLLGRLVNPAFGMMNLLGIGLEQEVYLARSSASGSGGGGVTKCVR